jgi:hypothetical protein
MKDEQQSVLAPCGFVTRLTRVPLVEQEQPTFSEFTRFLVGFVLLDVCLVNISFLGKQINIT